MHIYRQYFRAIRGLAITVKVKMQTKLSRTKHMYLEYTPLIMLITNLKIHYVKIFHKYFIFSLNVDVNNNVKAQVHTNFLFVNIKK